MTGWAAGIWPWAGLLAAGVWALLAIWLCVLCLRSRREAARQRQRAEIFRAIALTAPGGYAMILDSGACLVGGAARRWFGVASAAAEDAPAVLPVAPAALAELADREAAQHDLLTPGVGPARCCLQMPDGLTVLAEARDCDLDGLPGGRSGRIVWLQPQAAMPQAEAVDDADPAPEQSRNNATVQWREMFDSLEFPVWIRAPDMRLDWVNRAYADAVEGASPDDVITRQVELVSNALTGNTLDMAREAQRLRGRVAERHFAVIGGQRRALSVVNRPVDDRVVGYAIDVTDSEDMRAELSRAMDGFAETLNKLSAPVAIFDPQTQLQFFNAAFARLSRLSEDWLYERPSHADLLEAMRETRRLPEQADFKSWKKEQLDRHTSPEPAEDMWHLPDGSTLRVVSQPHPLGGLLLLFEDVTDRLALESSYNALIAVQRETLDNLHEAVAVHGSDARLKLYNPSYMRIWGLDTGFLDAEPHFSDLLDRARPVLEGRHAWREFRDMLLNQVVNRRAQTGRWERRDGVVLDYAIVPLPDGRVLTTHLDVTDSVRIEQALRERNEALETADRMKSEFVANMSYELRTPLNSIIGFTELLETGIAGPMSDAQRDYLGYVLQAARQLRELIDDILDLAVIEAGGMTLDISEIDAARLVDSAIAFGRERARKAGLQLMRDVSADAGSLEGDSRRLTQALYNLVTNAITYTPSGGKIVVAARPGEDDDILLSVSDTGTGIADSEQEKVFERFHRGKGAQSASGAGLGLAVVKCFVELHDGRIDLATREGEGTTVRITMPRRYSGDASDA